MHRKAGKNPLVTSLFFLVTLCLFALFTSSADRSSPVTVVFTSGTGVWQIGTRLETEGVVPSAYLFVAAAYLQKGRLMAGEYTFVPGLSTFDVARKMALGERNIYTLTIIEGDTLYNVAEAMEKSSIMESGRFLRLVTDGAFLKRVGIEGSTAEGYLYPDTYYYSREIDGEQFVEKIAGRRIRFFARDDIRKRMAEIGFNAAKTLTLASMIEKEARIAGEKPVISGVFHNRLAKGMSLDCDPTIIYGTGRFGQPITKSDLKTYTPYNTYRFTGLPAGPIANPDNSSIMAALYPARGDYFYFVSKNDGTHVFSKDMQEHNHYVMLYQRTKKTKHQ